MIVRRGNITDVFELSRLWCNMVLEQDKTATPDLEMWRGYIANLMKSPAYFMFVAEHENRLVGMIDYCMIPEPGRGKDYWKAVGTFFYILPEFRGGEAVRLLWAEHEKSARENNAKELVSMCFPEKLDYWEKHGFSAELLAIRRIL
jgi:GNAT superfamily N-acetyltransferase